MRKWLRGMAAAAGLALVVSGPVRAQEEAAETVTVYEGARVLDIASGAWRDASIVVRGERIAALLAPGEAAPEGPSGSTWRGAGRSPG